MKKSKITHDSLKKTSRRFRLLLSAFLILFTLSCCSDKDNNTDIQDNLPPDPGVAGKATLEGIDTDKDGLRDDVQRYIYMNFNKEDERKVLINLANNIQIMILNSQDKNSAINAAQQMSLNLECLYYLNSTNASKVVENIEALSANTELRFAAYMKANENLSGETFLSNGIDNFKDSCF
jgi:hypothetical protein